MKKRAMLALPLLAVMGCSTVTKSHSSFRTPSNIGFLGPSLTSALRGTDITANQDGYAYAVGEGADGEFYGYAGIIPTTRVTTPPLTGSATWTGTYKLAQITGIELPAGGLQGYKATFGGPISLTANFAAGTLIGGATPLIAGTVPELSINGTFAGSTLSGSATFRGLTGALTGLVGATGAVGAFQGNQATDLYAGGFMVGTP